MLRSRIWNASSTRYGSSARSSISHHGPRPVPTLPDGVVETFRLGAFSPAVPARLPPQHFVEDIPAIKKWFSNSGSDARLNLSYLSRFGSTLVPLEITDRGSFVRIEQPLSFFLECVRSSSSRYILEPPRHYFTSHIPGLRPFKRTKRSNDFFNHSATTLSEPTARVYLAQAPIADLPRALQDDLPTPEIVMKAGKGDIYDSSIWLGKAPTYTPLHRDPNPNLFVQLAGRKIIRLMRPELGRSVFAAVQEQIGQNASATIRGEEMMQGAEKAALREAVWANDRNASQCMEAEVVGGDAIFIPKGWWHSVRGLGSGMTGSVNWWFR